MSEGTTALRAWVRGGRRALGLPEMTDQDLDALIEASGEFDAPPRAPPRPPDGFDQSAPPRRPDGFDQSAIDAAKAALLATGTRSGR